MTVITRYLRLHKKEPLYAQNWKFPDEYDMFLDRTDYYRSSIASVACWHVPVFCHTLFDLSISGTQETAANFCGNQSSSHRMRETEDH